MTNNDKIKKSIIENIVVISIMVLYIVYGIYYLPLLMLIIPIPFIVIGIRNGIWNNIISVAITSLIVGILIGMSSGIFLLLITMPLSFAINYCIKVRKKTAQTILITTAALFVSIVATISMEASIVGLDFVKYLEQTLTQNLTTQLDVLKDLGMTNYEFLQTEDLLEMTYQYIMVVIPSLLFIVSLIISYINNVFTFIILRKMGYGIVYYPSFSRFKLPNNIIPGIGVMLISSFIISKLQITHHEALLLNITFLIGFIFFVQGLSVLDFLLKRSKIKTVFRVIMMILNIIFVPMSGVIFFIGILDSVFDMRKIRKQKSL